MRLTDCIPDSNRLDLDVTGQTHPQMHELPLVLVEVDVDIIRINVNLELRQIDLDRGLVVVLSSMLPL